MLEIIAWGPTLQQEAGREDLKMHARCKGKKKNGRYKLKEKEYTVQDMRRGLYSHLNINFKSTTSNHAKI